MRISDWSSDVCSSDLAERLPIGPIPEQPLVTAVRNLVINDGGDGGPTFLDAHNAEWMRPQEACARRLPLAPVSTLCRLALVFAPARLGHVRRSIASRHMMRHASPGEIGRAHV